MKRLAKLAENHADNMALYQESQEALSDFIVVLLKPVIPSLLSGFSRFTLSSMLCFEADRKYLTYTEERRTLLGDVLNEFMAEATVNESCDLWIADDEACEIRKILEEAL